MGFITACSKPVISAKNRSLSVRILLFGLAALVAFVILGFVALAVFGYFAAPGLLRARQAGNEASAIGSMRAIVSAQLAYSAVCGQGSYAPTFDALIRPGPGQSMGYLSSDMSGGDTTVKSGYRIVMTGVPDPNSAASCNGTPAGKGVNAFSVVATPEGDAGGRYFGTNGDGAIYHATTAFVMPPTGAPSGATLVQ
jgi:hypothetical protein